MRDASPGFQILITGLLLSMGCASVSEIQNLSEESCRRTFREQLASILVGQREKPDVANRLAGFTEIALERGEHGPRPFLVSSPSGTDYSLFVQRKGSSCLLRLYGRQKGFVSYTNNLSYIATRPLAACACRDERE
jgi:hypothetical protein